MPDKSFIEINGRSFADFSSAIEAVRDAWAARKRDIAEAAAKLPNLTEDPTDGE